MPAAPARAPSSESPVGLAIMLPARLVFALIAQGLTAGVLLLSGQDEPWTRAASALPVWGTAVDVACLVLLAALAHREGLRLRDLLPAWRWRTDGPTALAYAGLMLLVGGVGGTAVGLAIYGKLPPSPMTPLPLWGVAWGALVWPVLWGLTEQLTYNGYALPRLEALTGRPWLAGAVVAAAWSLQHVAMPLRFDATFVIYRGLSALPAVGFMIWLFMRGRRLAPLIAAHIVVDSLAVLSAQLA